MAITVGRVFIASATLLCALSVTAHHSGAMFEDQKLLVLAGTVRIFQWSNPHCWIQMLVPGRQGTIEWSVEMGSPSQLFRGGWKPSTLKYGDGIVVTVHPMRDGTNGGLYMSASRRDGKPMAESPAN